MQEISDWSGHLRAFASIKKQTALQTKLFKREHLSAALWCIFHLNASSISHTAGKRTQPESTMQRNNPPIYLPDLGDVIDRYPLVVTSETPLLEVIALMGQLRSSCPIGEVSRAGGFETIPASPLLGEARASCVLVIDSAPSHSQLSSRLQGIFTERDIVTLIASAENLKQLTIAEVMTQPVIAVTESEAQDVFTVLILLRQHRIRHLPILDDRGNLLGVVTPESIRQAMLQPANLLKMRRVEEVMTSDVIQAPATASVMSLARVMTEHRVSCVVIVKQSGESGGAWEKSPPAWSQSEISCSFRRWNWICPGCGRKPL